MIRVVVVPQNANVAAVCQREEGREIQPVRKVKHDTQVIGSALILVEMVIAQQQRQIKVEISAALVSGTSPFRRFAERYHQ